MLVENTRLVQIGRAVTPYTQQKGTPIQPWRGESVEAHIEIYPEFRDGLNDLERFDRIWVLSLLHESTGFEMRVIPYRDTLLRGLFATRSPRRPNPIGMSLVTVDSVDIEKGIIRVQGIDLLNNTPIIDIKPYVPQFESIPDSASGWLENGNDTRVADDRFDKTD
ncbi:MAG: tRNA (N6-threonylcarbamoyladenosine(37)-N6)-methyltransferase TrmO [Calditrichaeota bacterium]|jgi:tRNA (adenine37-N6)-methyltransferase|nr:tRNA (N6-threonylcarbamoyladenosine(37)-N6)-methyltransferase TrmO [Calditrichota bacterium]MBT7790690.1 tRNA (N6-threonylcarbamoyladenosine(37)-N6)-methyltransferase TrmO [Calditrichota bacterium]